MMWINTDIDARLYFYDADDVEHVGTVVERHEVRRSKKRIETYVIVVVEGNYIRVDEVKWRVFECAEYEHVSDEPLCPIRKGAIVYVDFTKNPYDHGVIYEAEVLNYKVTFGFGYFTVRWRKTIKASKAWGKPDKTFTQAVEANVLKLIRNGKGRRLVRG